MQASDLIKHVNSVVTLDMVNGKEITARLIAVDDNAGTASISKPLMFMLVDPARGQVAALPYGYPLNKADDKLVVELSQIITAFKPVEDQIKVYERETSGIVTAPAGALNDLPPMGEGGPSSSLIM